MKTGIILLCIIIMLPAVALPQSTSVFLPEQEQAVSLSQRIATEKRAYVRNADELFERLLEEGHDLWRQKQYAAAKQKFTYAQRLRPSDEAVSRLIFTVGQDQQQFEARDAERRRTLAQQDYLLETTRSWLIKPPPTTATAVTPAPDSAEPAGLADIAARRLVSLDFQDVQLSRVLEFLSVSSGINIVIDESVVVPAGALSIQLTNVTLPKALEAVLRTKGLTYRFEDDFIWVSSNEGMRNETMVIRFYPLSQGLATFTDFATFNTVTVKGLRGDAGAVGVAGAQEGEFADAAAAIGVGTYEGVKIGGAGGVAGKVTTTVKDILLQLIDWPQGSRIFLDNRTSTLIVRNTPSHHAELSRILEVLDVNPPQVMIEARFVEIGADDLYDLGLQLGGKISATGAVRGHSFPIGKDRENHYMTPAAVRGVEIFGSGADSVPVSTLELFDFQSGKLDFSQFQAVLSALESKGNSNILSSPKITTISGQEAVIKIVQEFRYPTRFALQTVSVTVNNQTSTEAFPFPDEFATRDLGIILKVTPNVGTDGKTINLTVVPEVSEFAEFYNYGTDDRKFEQPFFNVRSATASIVLHNNETVVLGGLMREVIEDVKTSVPILGKVPLLGALFRNNRENRQKRNLLIFITARIIAPTGEQVVSVNPRR